ERPLSDAGGFRDLDDRRLVEADVAEHLLGGLEQLRARLEPARRERAAVGALKRARRASHHAISSSSVGPSATTNATPHSPQRSCGTPTTAASCTCGCSWSTASTSAGY